MFKSIHNKGKRYRNGAFPLSMADARFFVLELFDKAKVEEPSGESLEDFASELVRLKLEAHEARTFPLPSSGQTKPHQPPGRLPISFPSV